MKKLYKLLLICLLTIAGGGNALKAQSYNSDNSETANRAETPTYISKIAVAYGAKESTPKDILKNNGFTIIDKDLNDGCGASSHYIYMGYKTTTNPAEAITGIFFRTGENPPNSATFDGVTAYLLGGSNESNPGENTHVDLNADAGGQYIYTYVTRNTSRAAVINGMYFDGSNSASGYVTPNVNLNSGTKGDAIYLHYKQFSGKASATFHYLNSSGSRTSSTTSVSVKHHQQAVNNTPSAPTSVTYDGRTWTLLGWREDNNATTAGSNPSYTYMDSKVYRAVYSADVSITYNANGGSNAPSKQTAKQYVNAGSSSIAKSNTSFTIPSTTPTHDGTKCNFAGWGTSSSSTTAQYQAGGSISINTNTTLYAVWTEHNGTKTYVNNGSNHTYTWSCCQKSVTEDHIYNNGIDNYCGAHIHEIDGNGYCHLCDGYPAELVNGYYEIKTADNLFWFAEYVNTMVKTASAKLMNDIDLENRPWTPIGTTGESSHNFRGHFDGNGKTITGLNVEVTRNGGGFFGEVRLGTVEDFTIYGEVKLNGKHSYVGGVIGSAPGANSNKPEHNGATIRNITSYVNVTLGEGSHGSNHVAGFIGYANHETLIENCTWYGTLDLDAYRAQDGVGGLVGKANDNSEITIRNCAAYGTIKTSYQSGSYSDSNNVPFNSIYIGGIVSNSVESAQTTLENCIWAGTLIDNTNLGSNAHISAIGTLDGIKSVSNCYALDNMPYITTNNAHNEGITEVTAEQLASGEIAYKLQGTQATPIWGQNIDNGETADSKPILGGAKVYEHTFDGTNLYSNSQTLTAGGKCGNNLYWTVSNNTLTIFGTGAMYDYGNSSSNKAPWRSLNPAPTSLVMEDGITHIGNYAFRDCSGFTGSLTIPNSVTTIGDCAFQNCSGFNGSLTIGNSVTSIGNEAFRYCSGFTGSLTIPNSVTSIGISAFDDCNKFTGDLTIPNSVTTIGNYAFQDCSGFTGSLTIPNSVTTIGNYAFYNCSGFTGSLTIPNSVTTIGNSAFLDCSGFTGKLTIPNSVTSIGNEAFRDCSGFTGSLTIPNSVTSIGNSAFYNCKGFTGSLTIGNSVTSIGYEAFYYCIGFTGSLTIPNSVTYIGDRAFYYCKGFTGSLTIGNSVTTIGDFAFQNCSGFNGSLTIPNSVTYIGNYAFQNCSGFNGSLTIPNSVTTIGEGAFKYCSGLTGSLTIGNSVTTIGESAFRYCSGFTGSLTIPNSVTTIGLSAFYDCSGFTGSLTIGNSVTTIGGYAFYNCKGFTEVYSFAETAPTLGENAFNKPNNATLYYPSSSKQSYNNKGWFNYFSNRKAFNGQCGDNLFWSVDDENTLTIFGTGAMDDYDNIDNKAPWRNLETPPTSLVMEDGITHIGNYAFHLCSGFTGSLTIPNSVTTIGDWAFDGCSGFKGSLTIGNSVTTIGDYAFYECIGFTGSLTIPNSVTTIGDRAFNGCSGFTGSLTIGNSVTTIGNRAFFKCSGFNGSLTIPNSVTTIGNEAFYDCEGFTGSLTIPNSVTYIGDWAFADCRGFTGSLTIPNSVTTIGNSAFRNCSGFNGSLTIPNSVTSIGNYAFRNCSGFSGNLTIPNSVTTIGDYAFYDCEGFTEVYSFAETAPTLGTNAFKNTNENATLYYPSLSKQSYEAEDWFDYFPKHIGYDNDKKCGDNLYWYVDDENTLTIFGTGAMYDYGSDNNKAPWRSLNLAPKSLVLEEGITHIGNSAFHGCSSFNGSLTIPNSVITIGVSAFDNCGFTGDLTIPNNVTSIGKTAFWACKGFTGSLTIPNSVTTIGDYAFQFCDGFTKVYSFAETAPTLGTAAFSGINNNAILYYPASSEQSYDENGWFNYFTKRIGFNGKCGDNLYWHVDENNALTIYGTGAMDDYDNIDNKAPWLSLNPAPTSLVLEKGITYIGNYAFYECYDLTEVHSSAVIAPTLGTEAFANINENAILYHPVLSEPSYEEKGWFEYFLQHVGADGKCGDNLFWYVDDENTLTIFGTGAMYDYGSDNNKAPWRSLNLAPKSLVLEEGITHIGNSAFHGCSSFTGSLTIPNSVITIGVSAFDNCGFTGDLTIPNNVTSIGKTAFWACKGFTGSLTIPNSVTSIGNNAFQYCDGFTEVYSLAKTAPTIGTEAFTGTNSNAILYYPVLSEPSYEEKGWFDYFPQHIGLFDGKCGDNLYWAVNDNVLMISGAGAMYDYDNIDNKAPWRSLIPAPTSLVLEEGITHIGNAAFYGCEGLIEVHSSAATAPTLGTEAFANINENAILYHPVSSEPSYEEKGWFKYFIQHVVADGKCGDNLFWYVDDENILTIFGTGAMYDYGSDNNKAPWRSLNLAPKSLVLEEGITHIGNSAFHGCSSFTGSLTIPNSVITIGVSAFDNCGFTGDLTIPNNVTSIGKTAFWACKGFTGSLTIPNSVTTIGDYAFQYCDGFTGSLTIGNSVTTIGNNAFQKCSGFTEIFFYRDTNPTIRPNAFSDIYAKVCAPVIWESFRNIPSGNLVKMATFVGEQSAVSGQQSGWVFPEGMTEVGADAHVAINAPLVLSGQQSAVSSQQSAVSGQQSVANSLSVKSFGLCGNGTTVNGSITIEDGAQLYCEIANGEVTVKKEILGYQQSAVSGQQSESESKWYTIASPLKDTIQIIPNSSFLTSNSDLYRYDEPSYTWQNAKNSANNGFNTIDPGRGYLYANAENTSLKFTGDINTETVTYNLTAKSNVLKGFHLIGNPFTHNITFAHLNATEGASLVNGYYVLNGEGAWGATLGSNEDDVIKVGQGVLVKAKSEGTLAISRQPSAVSRQQSRNSNQQSAISQQSLCISVSNAKYSDRAFVVFDKGVGLDKMNHENENIPLLYIPMEDADYAIAMMDINVNEIPVNFETNVMGEYTISLRQENCEFDELYLLDKETDEKVNILEQDYTFIATSSENPERFILMKDAQGSQLEAHSHFAYINNGDIVIYNIEGDADIKIFDALGRCVYHGESSDETTRIANGYSSGVYMIQKVDDNGVKVQKIIL